MTFFAEMHSLKYNHQHYKFMKKKLLKDACCIHGIQRLLRTMKITVFLLFIGFWQLSATTTYSQNIKLDLSLKEVSLREVFEEIEKQSDCRFLFRDNIIDSKSHVTINMKGTVDQILKELTKDNKIEYQVLSNNLIVISNAASSEAVTQQQKSITGKVTDSSGAPLPGVSVVVKGTTTGIITDGNGSYSLTNISEKAVLQFSFVGMKTQEVPVSGKTTINVTLLEDAIGIEEVVAVGYGTQKKGMITGSIAAVQSEKLTVAPVGNTTNSLAGRLPGLVSKQVSGMPGADAASLSIRGFGDALIIIDGIEGSLSNLDPNQIESVSILKDGAASIYGARAGNGVILVTTKRGTNQKPTITLNSSMTYQQPTYMLKPASSGQRAEMAREEHLNAGNSEATAPYTTEQVQKFYDGSDPWNFPNTDWYSELMRDWAPEQQHNISARGGSEKIKYYGFFGYLDQETMIKKNGGNYGRYNLQSNIDAKITDNLTLELNLSAVVQDNLTNTRSGDMAVGGNIWQDYWRTSPMFPAHLPDPTKIPFADGAGTGGLHVTSNMDITGYRKSITQDLNGQAGLKYNIKAVKGLSARAFVSYFKRYNTTKLWELPVNLYTYDPEGDIYTLKGTYGTKAQLTQWASNNHTFTQQYSLNYDNTFGNDHHVTAMALFESIDYGSETLSAMRKDYMTTAIDQMFAGNSEGMSNDGSATEMGRSSYVGRLNYSYKGKYLFESILRADASAKFPEEKRWGYFPSASLGWILSEEGFMKGFSWIDNLKLRASYGESGNDAIGNFQYLSGFKPSYSYLWENANLKTIMTTGLANPLLTWERMKIYNLGLEYSFFNHKLYGEADAFYRQRDGIAYWNNQPVTRATSLPSTFGSAMPPENLNSTNDRGFEFSAGTRGKLGELSYDLSANISWSRAKWDHYEEPDYTDPDQKRQNQRSGQWIDRSFGYRTNGLFTSQSQIDNLGYDIDKKGNTTIKPGDVWILDTNDDKVIDWKDQEEIGVGTTPHWMVGFDATLRYKQFDLAALFQGAFGYYTFVQLSENSTVKYENRWTPENNDPHAFVPRLGGFNGGFSDYFYQKSGYLRLKTASLGYNLPKRLLDKIAFSEARIYVSGVNLLTMNKLAKFGIDPESPSQGSKVGYYYPQQRTISVGVNVSF